MPKKQADEEKLTISEAFITFQLQVKRKEVAEFQEEVSLLEYKNQRFKDQRKQLKEEQMGHVKTLHKQLKDKEGKLAQKEVICREQVEEAIQSHLDLVRSQEQELTDLQGDLRSLEEQVKVLQAEKQIWLDYKMVGSQENQQQIQQLENELTQMHKTFQEMSESIDWTMKEDMRKTDRITERKMEKEKHLASERAIEHLDKHSRMAIKDNKWLKKALSFYRLEVSRLEESVQKLEERNLLVLSDLFDLQFCDPSIFSDICPTKEAGPVETTKKQEIKEIPAEASRALDWATVLDRDGASSSCSQPAVSPTLDITDLLYGRQSNSQDCPHLGGLKLLNMEGKTAPLHPLTLSPCGSMPPGLQQVTSDWPVTTRMILDKFK